MQQNAERLYYTFLHHQHLNMAELGLARADKDNVGGAIITSGSTTVFGNDAKAAFVGSSTAKGQVISNGSKTVFINDKMAARYTDTSSAGQLITSSSTNIFVG